MKKPSILFLSLRDYSGLGLEKYFDIDLYNYKMPTHVFFEKAKSADIIIETEYNDGRSIYSMLVAQVNVKKAIWLIDTYCRPDHPTYAQSFDTVFISMKTMEHKFTCPVFHLPLSFNFSIGYMIFKAAQERQNAIAFIGHIDIYALRKEFFSKFEKDLTARDIKYCFKIAGGKEFAEIIQNSIIGFNKSQGNEVNFRVFENMGFGCLLLTDYNKEFDFIPGLSERSFLYNSYEDIFAKMEQMKLMPHSEVDKIIQDNQQWIRGNHLFLHRILEITNKTINYTPSV